MSFRKRTVAVSMLAAAVLTLPACIFDIQSKEPEEKKILGPAAVLFYLGGSLPTFKESGGLLPSVSRSQFTLEKLIDRAALDFGVHELVARIGGAELSLARAEELASALRRFSSSGKPVTCHIDYADNLTYWLAVKGCSRILLSPAGSVEALGISLETIYLKELLSTIGVQADFLSVGRYKDAYEPFMRDGMSPDSKHAAEELIGELHQDFVAAIAAARKMDKGKVQELLDSGPFDAATSVELGLVDEAYHLGDYLEKLREKYAGGVIDDYGKPKPKPFSITDLLKKFSGSEDAERKSTQPHMAIVPIIGPINSGVGDDFLDDMEMVKDGEMVKALGELKRDDSVRAVVLRIDSPGGSALASDNIWRAVRSLGESKPVVASMGDVAASGGYYIAAAASEIFASATTLTGSIGVVGGKIVFADGATKLGVRTERVSFGKRAGMLSPFSPFSDGERATMKKLMKNTYQLFIDRVALGRGMDKERVLQAAEGRVWTGKQAKEMGLVDEEGGLSDAIKRARTLAKLPADAPAEIFPPPRSIMDLINEAFTEPEDAVVKNLSQRYRVFGRAFELAELLRAQSVLTFTPIMFEIR